MRMKKLFTIGIFLSLILSFQVTFGQGLENFANYPETANAYHDGTFTGQDGSLWSYTQCRGDCTIVAPSPCLGKNRTPPSDILSGSIAGGCGTFNFDYKQAFSTNVNLDVYVNGLIIGTVTSSSEVGIVKNSGTMTANVGGNFTFEFKQHDNATSGQVVVDNVSWTSYSGSILPEPSEYPTNFAATASNFTITLNWTDAGGAQPPTAYLLLGSSSNNIVAPVDGTPVANNPNLYTGSAAMNVLQGVHTYTFTGLPAGVPYYFKIFPYTNSGSEINFKTDGTPPSATVTTPNTVIINSKNFNDYSFAPWTTYSVTGVQVWAIDSIHGVAGGPCAKMSGYSGGYLDNEDWLISPAMNFDNYTNETMNFQSAFNYTGDPIALKISNNYDGAGNPNDFTWSDLTATLSPGGWAWTSSGNVALSGTSGSAVHVAFKYTSNTTASSTWELDDIVITGETLVSVPQVNAIAEGFNVYPSPSHGIIKLAFNSPQEREISVMSVLGSKVFEQISSLQTQQIDLTGMEKGVYFIQVKNLGETRINTKKIVLY